MRYAQIRKMDISNGEGVGVALFVQGCPFHCYNCFNQETWNFNEGKEWTENIENCFFDLINRNYIRRVSFLGGEPLANQNVSGMLEIVHKIRILFPDKKIWMYSGFTWEEIFNLTQKADSEIIEKRKEIIGQCDILVDGRYVDEQKDLALRWRGSANQRVIDVQESLFQSDIVLHCK
mgnify:CR=1 FL=1